MKTNNTTVLKCMAVLGCILILKSFFSLNLSKETLTPIANLEQSDYSEQYKISKENFNDTDRSNRNKKIAQDQKRFKFKKTDHRRPLYKMKPKNIAKAPTNDLLAAASNKNEVTKTAHKKKSAKNNEVEEGSEEETDKKTAAKNNKEKNTDEKSKKDSEENKEQVAVNDLVPKAKPLTDIESKDLSLLNQESVIDNAFTYTTNLPNTNNNNNNAQPLRNSNSSIAINDRSNDDQSDENDESRDEDGDGEIAQPTAFSFDPATASVIDTLVQNGDIQAINTMLESSSIDRKTAYYQLVDHSSKVENSNEIDRLIQIHFFNTDSVSLLSQHLVDSNIGTSAKQISYSFLMQLVSSWPLEDAERFNAIFVNGVNEELSGPTSNSNLTPDQELYLQLSNAIFDKQKEITNLAA